MLPSTSPGCWVLSSVKTPSLIIFFWAGICGSRLFYLPITFSSADLGTVWSVLPVSTWSSESGSGEAWTTWWFVIQISYVIVTASPGYRTTSPSPPQARYGRKGNEEVTIVLLYTTKDFFDVPLANEDEHTKLSAGIKVLYSARFYLTILLLLQPVFGHCCHSCAWSSVSQPQVKFIMFAGFLNFVCRF